MDEKFKKLKEITTEISALRGAAAVLDWDRETLMPPGGAADRANQLSFLARLAHERMVSDELGQLLEDLQSDAAGLDPDSDEARLVSVTKRDYDLEKRVPARLVEDISRASSDGVIAWRKARAEKDYTVFAPALKRNAELNCELAQAIDPDANPYDALLSQYEPGIDTGQLEKIFSELKDAIIPLLDSIKNSPNQIDNSILRQEYDEATQIKFALSVVEQFGYDLSRGRLDRSPHPFCTSFGWGDVRLTTRVYPDFLNMALFATMHESGHGMYEQGWNPNYSNTMLAHGASGGVHESQSRLWENLVGRSRPFQDYLLPRLQETFPSQLGGTDKETFYKAINRVQPSLIRVTADEVTYNLHIILRYEFENEMLAGKVDFDSLAEDWVERMRNYFGVIPEDDVEGVLQDIHWSSAGQFAIFPSYTLGNVIGAQLFRRARKDMPDLDEKISRGEFSDLLGWLQSNLYTHGRKFTPNELMVRITGQPVGTEAWISYITEKYSELYDLK